MWADWLAKESFKRQNGFGFIDSMPEEIESLYMNDRRAIIFFFGPWPDGSPKKKNSGCSKELEMAKFAIAQIEQNLKVFKSLLLIWR
ncbi:hypothetical protein AHAS_Ahas14G0022100 [Arachis hypogaea]